jgi:hypothetical protein
MSDYGRPVLRFWRVRPSECDQTVDSEGGYACYTRADRRQHVSLSQRERRTAHDMGAGARWLPWAIRIRLGDHRFDLSCGLRAGWADLASSILRTSIADRLDRLERLASRLERPLPPHLDRPEFHYADSVTEQANNALWMGFAAGKGVKHA